MTPDPFNSSYDEMTSQPTEQPVSKPKTTKPTVTFLFGYRDKKNKLRTRKTTATEQNFKKKYGKVRQTSEGQPIYAKKLPIKSEKTGKVTKRAKAIQRGEYTRTPEGYYAKTSSNQIYEIFVKRKDSQGNVKVERRLESLEHIQTDYVRSGKTYIKKEPEPVIEEQPGKVKPGYQLWGVVTFRFNEAILSSDGTELITKDQTITQTCFSKVQRRDTGYSIQAMKEQLTKNALSHLMENNNLPYSAAMNAEVIDIEYDVHEFSEANYGG